jgi:hypothetical protein
MPLKCADIASLFGHLHAAWFPYCQEITATFYQKAAHAMAGKDMDSTMLFDSYLLQKIKLFVRKAAPYNTKEVLS